MKKFILLLAVLTITGCAMPKKESNSMQMQLSQYAFYGEGVMETKDSTYTIKMRREDGIRTLTIVSEKMPKPISYTLEEGAIMIGNDGADIVKLETDKIPENCIALQVWNALEHLSTGTTEKTDTGISIVKQDRAVATASNDKKIQTIQLPSEEIKITFNQFEYLQK